MFGNLKNRLMKEMEGLEGKLANIGGKQTKNGTDKSPSKSEEDISSVEKTGAEGSSSSLKEEGEKINSEGGEDGNQEVKNSENSEEETPEESQKTDGKASGITEKEDSSVIEDIKINHSIKQAVKTGPDGEISVYPLGVKVIQNDGHHPLAPSSGENENISNQSSPNPIDKLSKMDNPTKADHRHNFEMENKSAKVHENQSKNSGQEKTHEKVNKVQDGKKFDRSHDNPEYENHLKFQNHTGAEQEDEGGPEDENEGEDEGEQDDDQEVEDQPEVKPEVSQLEDTKPEMNSESDSKIEKHSKITVEVDETKYVPSQGLETDIVNEPEVDPDSQLPPEMASKSEDLLATTTSSSLGEANKITESDKIQNMEEKTEKPFEPKMENGIETINIHQIDRQKNEIEVNANSEIDVNVNDDKNGQNGSSADKKPEVKSGSAEVSNEVESRRSRRAAARDKYGPELREVFKKVDKDGSGYASIDEMCSYMADEGKIKLNSRSITDFQDSMKHYFDTFNYDKTKPNELNETEFVKFWSDFYALFDKIDKNGDGEIAVIECVTLLDEKAEKFGLGKSDLYQRVVQFFNVGDIDGDRKISLIEFFIQLPKLEVFLINGNEMKPDRIKSEEVKSEEVESIENKSGEVIPNEVKSEEVKSNEVKSEEVKSDEVKSEEVKSEEVESKMIKSTDTESSEFRSNAVKSEVNSVEVKSENIKSEVTKSEVESAQANSEDVKMDTGKFIETKSEEIKSEEVKTSKNENFGEDNVESVEIKTGETKSDKSGCGLTKFVADVELRKSQQKLNTSGTRESNEKLEVVAAKATEDTTLNINTRKTLEKFLGKRRKTSESNHDSKVTSDQKMASGMNSSVSTSSVSSSIENNSTTNLQTDYSSIQTVMKETEAHQMSSEDSKKSSCPEAVKVTSGSEDVMTKLMTSSGESSYAQKSPKNDKPKLSREETMAISKNDQKSDSKKNQKQTKNKSGSKPGSPGKTTGKNTGGSNIGSKVTSGVTEKESKETHDKTNLKVTSNSLEQNHSQETTTPKTNQKSKKSEKSKRKNKPGKKPEVGKTETGSNIASQTGINKNQTGSITTTTGSEVTNGTDTGAGNITGSESGAKTGSKTGNKGGGKVNEYEKKSDELIDSLARTHSKVRSDEQEKNKKRQSEKYRQPADQKNNQKSNQKNNQKHKKKSDNQQTTGKVPAKVIGESTGNKTGEVGIGGLTKFVMEAELRKSQKDLSEDKDRQGDRDRQEDRQHDRRGKVPDNLQRDLERVQQDLQNDLQENLQEDLHEIDEILLVPEMKDYVGCTSEMVDGHEEYEEYQDRKSRFHNRKLGRKLVTHHDSQFKI